MDDKSLADAVVALGLAESKSFGGVPDLRYAITIDGDTYSNMYVSDFVRDWRVYGALYMLKNPDADLRQMIEDLVDE